MARRYLSTQDDDDPAINLSPMIDCIFILLIFFIVTTVFIEETGLQVNKPDAASAPPDEDSERIEIVINESNSVFINQREVGLAQVGNSIRNQLSNPDVPVSIRSHARSSHGVFVLVWDSARTAGAEKLSFSTVN